MKYATPSAFKAALEARLRATAQQTGKDQNRLRMRVVMDRFAARVTAEWGDDVVFKGGVVLELRLAEARATKDLDLHLLGAPSQALHRLQRAGRRDLGEHLLFEVLPDPRHPTIEAEGMQYEGLRFRVQPRLAGKIYARPFGVDAAFAEPMLGLPDELQGSDFLQFAGIPAPILKVYPLETHLAEKLHAYTVPRSRPNSRVKDLPDIALLARVRPIAASSLRQALVHTFTHRNVHPLPIVLPDPPAIWEPVYARMARRDQLPWVDLNAVLAASRAFIEPVLGGEQGIWDPLHWIWRPHLLDKNLS